VVEVHAVDPCNITGILLPGDRVRSVGTGTIHFRDGLVIDSDCGLDTSILDPATDTDPEIEHVTIGHNDVEADREAGSDAAQVVDAMAAKLFESL
jgi:hypothetical protein